MSRSRQPKVLTILSLALVAALFAVLVVRLTESDPGPGFVSAVRAGSKPAAPAFDLPVIWPSAETWPAQLRPGVGRGKVSLSDLRGFPTVLNFWRRGARLAVPRLGSWHERPAPTGGRSSSSAST